MTDPFESAQTRRAPLKIITNPRTGLDYVILLENLVEAKGLAGPVRLCLRYIPDSDIIAPEAFAAYADGLAAGDWETLEDLGQTVLGDINSELVPRWAQVLATIEANGQRHEVQLEDRRPNWDNPKLLARL